MGQYRHLYVPVDNSEYSNIACDVAVALARASGAAVTGSHVYAARMHDYRFRQMEFTLPAEYQDEQELEKQRRIHDSLITMGLQLISDSYLDVLQRKCEAASIGCTRKTFDGKNYQALVEDITAGDYDLVVMGALGLGAVKDSLIGSVTERVMRRVHRDLFVVRNTAPWEQQGNGSIVVGIDGSPQSYHGLRVALALGKATSRAVEAVGVYDPYLHYAMFNSIVGVLSADASRVFKFKEQEQLHEEVIDTGLAKIYQSHLEVAQAVAAEDGADLKITLLDGKAFEKLLQYVRKARPWLLVVGRVGVHSAPAMDIGSTTENLVRLAPCHVLLASGTYYPPMDVKAEASIAWTEEAAARMERVPGFVRGLARTAVLRYAIERGHSVITNSVIEAVMDLFMPKRTQQTMQQAALDLAIDAVRRAEGVTALCSRCGYIAKAARPVQCPVCQAPGATFQVIDRAAVEALATQEGALTEEETFDGVRLAWTEEARQVLRTVPSGYQRRRAKARIEKSARIRKLASITRDLAAAVVEETREETEGLSPRPGANVAAPGALTWSQEAAARLERVPAGFMRDITRGKIEALAAKRGVAVVTLAVAEEAIAEARETMAEMIQQARSPEGETAL